MILISSITLYNSHYLSLTHLAIPSILFIVIISMNLISINLSLIIHSIASLTMISSIFYSSHSLIHYDHVSIYHASFITPSMISIALDIFATIVLFIINDSLLDSINVLSFIH